MMKKTILGAAICLSAAALAAQTATIRIDAREKLHRITPLFIGVNLEDLNFQTYGGLYSQLLHGEAFQEHVDSAVLGLGGKDRLKVYVGENERGQVEIWGFRGRNWEHNAAREVLGLPAKTDAMPVALDELPAAQSAKLLEYATGQRQVSRHWRLWQEGEARGAFEFERTAPFAGRQSQRIRFSEGKGAVGIDNAGLNRLGIRFVAGMPYEGTVRVRADRETEVFVALLNADGSKTLAEKTLHVRGGRDYQKLDFTLTPAAADTAGRFAIGLKRPGSVTVGYAFLQPGPWGRFQDLPLRKDLVEAMIAMGVKVVRYDGSMVNRCPDGPLYKWKEMIGPRDQRKPYHGFFNPYASHGFAIFEFLDLSGKAGFLGIPGVRIDETPGDMADFIEYAKGPASSVWGRKRAADGHPAPYKLTHLEIGNEERLDENYCERFETLARAVWAKDRSITLVISHNLPRTSEFTIARDGSLPKALSLALRIVKFAREQKGAIWWDSHYPVAPDGVPAAGIPERIAVIAALHDSIGKLVPGYDLPFSPLEENGQTHDLFRALEHARNQNAFARMGSFIVALGVANTLQAYDQELIWSQGRIHFTPSAVIPQPPYLVDKVVTETWAPQMVATAVDGSKLDVASRLSEDGRRLVVYAVNDGAAPVDATINIEGFKPQSGRMDAIEIAGDPKAVNTPADPARIAPRRSTREYRENSTYRFPPFSYTVLRYE